MKAVSIILSFTLLLQSYAMAMQPSLISAKLQSAVERYNALSKTERAELFQEAMDERPAEDRKAIAPYLEEIKMLEWNDLKLDGHQVKTQIKGQWIEIAFNTAENITVQGRKLDLAPGQLQKTIDTLQKKSASRFLELFITYAHAEIVTLVLLFAAFVALATAFIMGISSWFSPWTFEEECATWKKRLSRWNTFDQGIKDGIEGEILKYSRALSRRRQKINCPASQKEECSQLARAAQCFSELQHQIESSKRQVNDTDRGQLRDAGRSAPRQQRSSTGRTQ